MSHCLRLLKKDFVERPVGPSCPPRRLECVCWLARNRPLEHWMLRPRSLRCRLLPLPCHYRSNHLALSRLLLSSASSVDKGGTRAARVVDRQAVAGLVGLRYVKAPCPSCAPPLAIDQPMLASVRPRSLRISVFVELVSRLCGARCLIMAGFVAHRCSELMWIPSDSRLRSKSMRRRLKNTSRPQSQAHKYDDAV